MTTETAEPTSQTGTVPGAAPANAQDFSDNEILDNFAEGPQPGDPPPVGDTHDDGVPMGLGGERGKQSEPAASTLAADIVNGTTKQPDEKPRPSDEPAGGPEPVQEPVGEKGAETSPEPTGEPETPEFPPMLLQMVGYADAAAAQADGLGTPEALYAYVRGRGQLLTPGAQPGQPSEQGLYRRPAQQPPAPPAPEPEDTGKVVPFQLPADSRERLDEDLLVVLDQMNEHYQEELTSLRSSVGQRESDLADQQAQNEEKRFDEAVQKLGNEWQDVFGEGNGMDLIRVGHRDPVAMTNFNHRAMLFETVEAIREVNAKQGYKPMTLEREMLWALQQRYPDKFHQVVSGNSSGKPGQGRGVTASRPTQRKTPPKSQNEKTIAAINAQRAKQGKPPIGMGEEEEYEGDI